LTWFLPSLGRPQNIERLWASPGGMPPNGVLVLHEDDPKRGEYKSPAGWQTIICPPNMRWGDVWRWIQEQSPNAVFYGVLGDDHEPITPGWHEQLEEAAGSQNIALANGDKRFPLIRNVCCIGGDLARAMGELAPGRLLHNYIDDVWDGIAKEFGLLRQLPDVVIRHRHPDLDPGIPRDQTYGEGAALMAPDALLYRIWLMGQERKAMRARVAKMLGRTLSDAPCLVIATPAHDGKVCTAYAQSLAGTVIDMTRRGIQVHLVMIPGEAILPKARNLIVELFLREQGTHLLFVDADMGWPAQAPWQLMQKGKDLVAAAGRRKTDDLDFCVHTGERVQVDKTGCISVDRVGTGFMMLTRSCLLRMVEAYPRTVYRDWQSGHWLNALFDNELHEHEYWSEDYVFCNRWRAIGGEIWVDPCISLDHVGSKTWTGALSETLQRADPPQAVSPQPAHILEAAE
jgi:hypothetical protein